MSPSSLSESPASDLSPVQQKAPIAWLPASILVGTFILALTVVPAYGWFHGYSAAQWWVFAVMLALCGFSITAGYHRLWSHRAYDSPLPVRVFWAIWGACALQNSILVWGSNHRRHHRHVDDNEKDPYSIGRGFWFAHVGWMFRHYPSSQEDFSNAADLLRDPVVTWQHRFYVPLVLATNIGIPVLLGWLSGDVLGMFLLAGVLRLVISHHVTFFINSLCHMWGSRPYTDTNTARDNPVLAVFTYGEGYHNFHHLFQSDYRNGVRWWQYDPTKWLIQLFSWLGLASNLRRTPEVKIRQAIMDMQFRKARAKLVASPRLPQLDLWKELIENEYQQFLDTLGNWKSLRVQWMDEKRQALKDKTHEFQKSMGSINRVRLECVAVKLKETELSLKLQQKRLSVLLGQISHAAT